MAKGRSKTFKYKNFKYSDYILQLLKVELSAKEINNIEKIKENYYSSGLIRGYEYIISDWEPGFLDYQWVLVYDKCDSLQNLADSKKMTSEGKLYILYRAKECFYLCVLYR